MAGIASFKTALSCHDPKHGKGAMYPSLFCTLIDTQDHAARRHTTVAKPVALNNTDQS